MARRGFFAELQHQAKVAARRLSERKRPGRDSTPPRCEVPSRRSAPERAAARGTGRGGRPKAAREGGEGRARRRDAGDRRRAQREPRDDL